MNTNTKMMKLVAVVSRGGAKDDEPKKNFWTTIGVAFQNRDGSWNLRFDYLPAHMGDTTIQLREFDPKEAPKAAAEPATAQ